MRGARGALPGQPATPATGSDKRKIVVELSEESSNRIFETLAAWNLALSQCDVYRDDDLPNRPATPQRHPKGWQP